MSWTAVNSEGYVAPVGLAVDTVVVTVREGEVNALVVRREDDQLALPGGFVGVDERPDDAARRKLHEKTGSPTRTSSNWAPSPTRTRPAWMDSVDRLPSAGSARHGTD